MVRYDTIIFVKRSITLVLFILLIPRIAFGVWWNPTTWNKKIEMYNAPRSDIDITNNVPINKTLEKDTIVPVEKVVVKEVPKIVEKIVKDEGVVQQNIYLTKQNDELREEIINLKEKIAILEREVDRYKGRLDEVTDKNKDVLRVREIRSKIVELEEFRVNLLKSTDEKQLLKTLINTTNLEGELLFPSNKFKGLILVVKNGVTKITSLPDKTQIINILDTYLQDIKNELYILEGNS